MTTESLSPGRLSLTAADFLREPYEVLSRLRRDEPLASLSTGGYLLTRHEDVSAALLEPGLGNAPSRFSVLHPRHAGKYLASAMACRLPPFLDMPAHRIPRQATTRSVFRALKGFAPVADALAEQHVNRVSGRVDLISTIAGPFACEAMAYFVGIEEHVASIRRMTSAFFDLFSPVSDVDRFTNVNKELAVSRQHIGESLRSSKRRDDDLISQLLRFRAGEPELSEDHVIDIALLVAADGVENIVPAIALVTRCLLGVGARLPQQCDASSLEPYVREALRLDTPAQVIPRVARDRLHMHGQEIVSGMPVFLALGSANRDSRAIPDPEQFDEQRNGASLTFGLGRHRCVGESLSVMMISALMAALLRRRVRQTEVDRQFDFEPRFGHRWPIRAMIEVPC